MREHFLAAIKKAGIELHADTINNILDRLRKNIWPHGYFGKDEYRRPFFVGANEDGEVMAMLNDESDEYYKFIGKALKDTENDKKQEKEERKGKTMRYSKKYLKDVKDKQLFLLEDIFLMMNNFQTEYGHTNSGLTPDNYKECVDFMNYIRGCVENGKLEQKEVPKVQEIIIVNRNGSWELKSKQSKRKPKDD